MMKPFASMSPSSPVRCTGESHTVSVLTDEGDDMMLADAAMKTEVKLEESCSKRRKSSALVRLCADWETRKEGVEWQKYAAGSH